MTGLFRTTVVEISGVRTIAGGGTNASNAGQALLNLSGVSITGDQTISGKKTFATGIVTPLRIGNPLDIYDAEIKLWEASSQSYQSIGSVDGGFTFTREGTEINLEFNSEEIILYKLPGIAYRFKSGYDGTVPIDANVVHVTGGNETISGVKNFSDRPTVNGTGVLLSGEIPQNKKFIYSGERRGPAARLGTGPFTWNNIAYGANCTFTPQYKGTIKAEASVGLTIPSTTSDTLQAATFWYGTGTPPVFSGNLNDLNNITRIGGIKGVPQQSATSASVQISPIGASWVAEITGLTTGTSYWFDIGMSGRFLYVQDVQIYLEEKY